LQERELARDSIYTQQHRSKRQHIYSSIPVSLQLAVRLSAQLMSAVFVSCPTGRAQYTCLMPYAVCLMPYACRVQLVVLISIN
jgi:hypothetical protein